MSTPTDEEVDEIMRKVLRDDAFEFIKNFKLEDVIVKEYPPEQLELPLGHMHGSYVEATGEWLPSKLSKILPEDQHKDNEANGYSCRHRWQVGRCSACEVLG